MPAKRLQITVDEDLDRALTTQAAAEGVSEAALARRYLSERLGLRPRLKDDSLWTIVGMVEDAGDDSLRANEVVYGYPNPTS
jgi:Ribbon-helix-helix protein, copG family